MKVKLTKITANVDSKYLTPEIDGSMSDNHPNIKIGYEKIGYRPVGYGLLPEVGQSYALLNGTRIFATSSVETIIDSNTFKTKNSVYRIVEIVEDAQNQPSV